MQDSEKHKLHHVTSKDYKIITVEIIFFYDFNKTFLTILKKIPIVLYGKAEQPGMMTSHTRESDDQQMNLSYNPSRINYSAKKSSLCKLPFAIPFHWLA